MRRLFVTNFLVSLLSISLLGAGSALAASSKVKGHVQDARTGDALPGATVLLVGTSLGASTDLDGAYTIENVPSGKYTLRATYVGYNPVKVDITISQEQTLTQDLKLEPVGIQTKNVVVTAQAAGQNSAINQQLTSNKIENVVSAAKIQELPDANAAESVGRLPGISLIRDGGEASEVVIRGLAPQYNQVLIDGVQMPATNSNDRGTDVSMISSSMLGGITVTKAITPDMDAAVIGGVVNFDLREAQNTNGTTKFNFTAQGGYNNLQTAFGPYKFVASAENRFLDDRLGILVEGSAENVNLGSNTFGASYGLVSENLGQVNPIYISTLNLDDVLRTRKRYGGTVTIDYKIPEGKIDLMNFVSNSNTASTDRGVSYDIHGGVFYNGTTLSQTYLNVITNLLDFQKSFSFINVDAKVSHSYSENHDPNDLYVGFRQNNVSGLTAGLDRLSPQQIQPKVVVNNSANYLYYIENYNTFNRDREFTGSVDFLSHINFSDLVTSSLKFGGMYRYTIRSHDYNQGDGVLDQASGGNVRAAIIAAYPFMTQPPYSLNPNGDDLIPLTAFADQSFSYGNFLHNDYTMGVPVNVGMLWNVLNIANKNGTLDSYTYNRWASTTYDYSGHEYEDAGYAMYTLNIGPTLTLLPGVRYQNLTTSYTAPQGFESSEAHLNYDPKDSTVNESHGYWLPMAHLIYKPLTWFQVHLAYTNTLTYPGYRSIIPWLDVGAGNPLSVTWNNYALKPGQSANYDIVLSAYDNTIGLIAVDGFLKHITNLIMPVTRYITSLSEYPIPLSSAYLGKAIYTYENNTYPIDDYGVELDWQTHFWYLPGPLSGLVLSVNYTHIFSSAKYLNAEALYHNPTTRGGQGYYTEVDTFYTDRLIDQPNDIANFAVGYDLKGFSIRVSMLYKSDDFTGEDFWPELRSSTSKYVRWDLAVKQNLPWSGMQVYFDMNNINGEDDISVIRGSGFPNSEQDYGMTADLGIRLTL